MIPFHPPGERPASANEVYLLHQAGLFRVAAIFIADGGYFQASGAEQNQITRRTRHDRALRPAPLPALLRARSGAVPSPPPRRDHARENRRADQASDCKTGLTAHGHPIATRRPGAHSAGCTDRLVSAVDTKPTKPRTATSSTAAHAEIIVSTRSNPPRLCKKAMADTEAPDDMKVRK